MMLVGGLLAASILALTTALRDWLPRGASTAESPALVGVATESGRAKALRVLRGWDARRAEAYASGDGELLSSLYTSGSRSGAADLRVLTAYADRGLRVVDLRTQILRVEVLSLTSTRLELEVSDRIASAIVVGPGIREMLPRDTETRRVIGLRRIAGTWLVDEVVQASPAATTSRTPGSENS